MTTELNISSLAFILVNYCGADDTIECIVSIENNKYDPTLALAFRLARELQVTVDGLFVFHEK